MPAKVFMMENIKKLHKNNKFKSFTKEEMTNLLHQSSRREVASFTLLFCIYLFISWFLRLVILRVHSHGLVTIDLQCYEEDNIAQLDNVGD